MQVLLSKLARDIENVINESEAKIVYFRISQEASDKSDAKD